MIFYIIRHGDPDYEHNTITPYGHQEAQALAQWLDEVEIDRIYTSPLGRAKDTAAYTAQRKKIEPIVLPWAEESMDYMRPFTPDLLCEYRFSTAQGISDYTDFHPEDRTPTLDRLVTGADSFLKELAYERQGAHFKVINANNESIALFCHGGFGTALTAYLLGLPPALGFTSMFMTTSSVTTFVFKDYQNSGFLRPRMLRFGEISHLHAQGLCDHRI